MTERRIAVVRKPAERKIVAEVTDMFQLQRALRRIAEARGVSLRELDAHAGISTSHSEKLLAEQPSKQLGLVSAFSLVGALGCVLALVEDPEAMARLSTLPRKRSRRGVHWRYAEALRIRTIRKVEETMRKIASAGGKAYAAATPPEVRCENARRAARARWHKRDASGE